MVVHNINVVIKLIIIIIVIIIIIKVYINKIYIYSQLGSFTDLHIVKGN